MSDQCESCKPVARCRADLQEMKERMAAIRKQHDALRALTMSLAGRFIAAWDDEGLASIRKFVLRAMEIMDDMKQTINKEGP